MSTTTAEQFPALSVQSVTKHYGSGFTLDDISFELPQGYIMGLIGPNGAGKSTLIKLILNMIHLDSGSIKVFGKNHIEDEETIKENLGVVFDSSYFIDQWTVSSAGKAMAPMYASWSEAKFQAYLDRFKLDRTKKIKELSRGMQMKLMLAVALSHDAKLLILDEPTSGLDVLGRDELMDDLRAYIEDGRHSVLFSTHITEDLERAADYITYITRGELYYTGPKDDFEDAFRIVRSGLEDFDAVRAVAIGAHRYATGFDALVRADQVATLSSSLGGLISEPPTIDDIIRLTNTQSTAVPNKQSTEHLINQPNPRS